MITLEHDSIIFYLDWNVMNKYNDMNYKKFFNRLDEKINSNRIIVFYTDEHLIEATNINVRDESDFNELLDNNLSIVSNITNNLFIDKMGDLKETKIMHANPLEVYEHKGIFYKAYRDGLTEALNKLDFTKYWKLPDDKKLSPKELNNYDPKVIIDEVNNRIKNVNVYNTHYDFDVNKINFRYFIDYIINKFGDLFDLAYRSRTEMIIAYYILDSLGYYSEKRTIERFLSTLFDAMHASNASYCTYFVTMDKKLKYKTIAIYKLMEINTEVLDIEAAYNTLK